MTYISPSIERILGYTPEEVIGDYIFEYAHADDIGDASSKLAELLDGHGFAEAIGYRFRHKDGSWRVFEVVGMYMEGPQGGSVVINARDITDRERAEVEIRLLNKELTDSVVELQEVNKELEAFSYSVSHDLRTPLRAVDGFSKILASDFASQLDEEGVRFLRLIIDNTAHMEHLIEDLLMFSRTGRQEMRLVDIDMERLALSVYEELGSTRDVTAVEFELGRLPAARGDRLLIHQVLANLIGNAIKFSSKCPAPRIEVSGAEQGGQNVYTIRDNGVGFDKNYATKLFGVFQRLHSQEEFEGTGVGLALVQRIVHRHGGLIWAESEPGEGAAFSFTLPGIAGSPTEGNGEEEEVEDMLERR